MPRMEEKKRENKKLSKNGKTNEGKKSPHIFCFRSVVLSQHSGIQERGDEEFHKNRGLYFQKGYTTNGGTHGMTFTHDI